MQLKIIQFYKNILYSMLIVLSFFPFFFVFPKKKKKTKNKKKPENKNK